MPADLQAPSASCDAISMENGKQLSLPGASEAFMKTADVLLVLDDGMAILCHSQILSLNSAVLCNMLADLGPSQHNEKVKVPLADFTEAQCMALLKYLYDHSVPNGGAAFKYHNSASLEAAVAVARFAHTHDAPHALRQVQAYLTGFVESHFKSKKDSELIWETRGKDVLASAIMADKFNMRELCGQCERAMVMH